MSIQAVLTTNYDFSQKFQLKINNAIFDMSAASLVSATLIDTYDDEVMFTAVAQTDSGNADWSTSLVEVVFSDTVTTQLQADLEAKYGDCECELILEIRVEQTSGETAWQYRPIQVREGFIT